MENQVTFPSQSDASKLLAEKIGTADTQREVDPAVSHELQKADEAHTQTLKNLGEVAAGASREIHVAPNGVVLTDREHQDVLARR